MQNRSVMQHAFSRVPKVQMPRSVFNRSHGYKCSFDADVLIPFYVDEVLPGDSFNLRASMLVRLNSPSIKPFMDNLWVDTFFFFVPNRLVWTNFVKFMGEQDNPADSISFTVPQITGPNVASGGIPIGHLYDYMGIPVGPLSGGGATTGITFNNLHGRAYNLTWKTWFRDENLQGSPTIDTGDGPDTFANYGLQKRGKRYDYFTSQLPWPLKGGVDVTIPLGSKAFISGLGTAAEGTVPTSQNVRESTGAGSVNYPAAWKIDPAAATGANALAQAWVRKNPGGIYPDVYADLSGATAATLNTLRQSITLQQFLERDARGGTRYPELVLSHFGVSNPDARVQRPEILSTSSERLNVTPVAQTTPKQAAGTLTDQGNLSGYGTGAFHGIGFSKSFTEHGVLLGLVSVRADLNYTQGMDRMWDRRTRYDFFWPIFQNLGEQATKNKEIYANLADGGGAAQKDGTFGYLPRYDEYRFKPSKLTGNMRSYNGNGVNANTLDVWHLAEAFASQPSLNSTFIQSSTATPLDRCIAVPSQDQFLMDCFFDLKCARVMPVFGVPGLKKL